MKTLILLMLLSVAAQECGGQKPVIIKATQQRWTGGLVGSGWGYNYAIYFTLKENKVKYGDIQPDSLWIAGKRLPLYVPLPGIRVKGVEGLPDDKEVYSYLARENHIPAMDNRVGVEPEKAAPPKGYESQTVVSYYINDQRYYAVIKDMQVIGDLNYK